MFLREQTWLHAGKDSLLEKAQKLRMERNQVCGELETMLNSCPGKGIVDPGCAKMMMGSDTFQQYLGLLNPKARASTEKVREKNRFRFGDNEIRMSFWSAVIPMNIGEQVCREKVAIVAGDAPFLFSKPFLQRMRAVLDLEKGQVTFNKLGVTMDLGESETGHYVNNLIPDCVDPIPDGMTLANALGSVMRNLGATAKDSGTLAENMEFSTLICGSEKVTIIDVDKPRVSLAGVDSEKSYRRWTIANFVSDSGVFVVKDECRK